MKTPPVVTELTTRMAEKARSVGVMWKAGLLPFPRLDEGVRSLILTNKFGPIAGAVRIAARRNPMDIGLVDERGPLTFSQLDHQSNALARA